MEENKNWSALVRLHDKDGEYCTLLNSLGFTVDPNQAEMLLALSKWHRMFKNGDKIPSMSIGNVNKFRELHFEFLKTHRQIEQEQKMKEAQEDAAKRLEAQGENVVPLKQD